ncbi:MAG: GNAT family N-acetyltransferase [Oscillospiraceae bacterium]|nr:GNAT family N-acetyltransferase [Oscillospiraceae bacterium]
MEIRPAALADLDAIMEIYEHARTYMAEQGNASQWGQFYPFRELLEEDIRKNQCYVCTVSGQVCGVFVLVLGEEPNYRVIEGGSWKNSNPYGVIHRLASGGTVPGVFGACLEFCKAQIPDLRADTHENNRTMQHLLEKYGFERRGVIRIQDGDTVDGSSRIAYQL